ncbi:hypothetical protein ACPEEZ_02465 [Frigoribacterium sp. 2-23]|uniref:hypothetical protein n=1 Tax=Frigoribacterium sp. 2-23 TaxID=3415006 RepID=UPI003C6F9914
MSRLLPSPQPAFFDLAPAGFSGDPVAVAGMADRYVAVADSIRGAAARLRSLDRGSMSSEAVEAFMAKADGLAAQLSQAQSRYDETGYALKSYSTSLQIAHDGAAPALRDFELARDDYAAAEKLKRRFQALALSDTGSADYHLDQVELQEKKLEEARVWIGAIRTRMTGLTDDLEIAAQRAITRIDDATADGLNDTAFDDFQGWMEDNDGWITVLLDIVNIAAMLLALVALFVPGLNVIMIGIMIAVAAAQAARWAAGTGSAVDFGMSLVSVFSFGTGAMVAKGTKQFISSVAARRVDGLVSQGTKSNLAKDWAEAALSRAKPGIGDKFLLKAFGDTDLASAMHFLQRSRVGSFADDPGTMAQFANRIMVTRISVGADVAATSVEGVRAAYHLISPPLKRMWRGRDGDES